MVPALAYIHKAVSEVCSCWVQSNSYPGCHQRDKKLVCEHSVLQHIPWSGETINERLYVTFLKTSSSTFQMQPRIFSISSALLIKHHNTIVWHSSVFFTSFSRFQSIIFYLNETNFGGFFIPNNGL